MRQSLPSYRQVILAASVMLVVAAIAYALAPMLLSHPSDYLGVHIWDHSLSYRYLVRKSILDYHQFPFWNPYDCGGHPAWGDVEGDSNVVSPLLPVYLLAPLATAARIEVVALTLWGAAGAWLLASRFTRSQVICALVAIIWSVNGRWAFQLTVGHLFHLEYAWMPWTFYFFDRAVDEARPPGGRGMSDVVLASVCMAMMVYMCGIYPLPHTALALAVYAACLAIVRRSPGPLFALAAIGVLSVAFAAPKLLPAYQGLGRFPRHIDSNEVFDPGSLIQALTDPEHQDDPWWRQGRVEGQWHEWGMYIGWPMLLVLLVGTLLARGPRETAMIWAGSALGLIALGRFGEHSPWALVHKWSVFNSQHVPSRALAPTLLPFACVAASTCDRLLRERSWSARTRFLVELALLAAVGVVAFRMEKVARQPLARAFGEAPPPLTDSTAPFVMHQHVPPEVDYEPGAWCPPVLPAEMANFGTTDCGTWHALFNPGQRTENRRAEGLGARGTGDPEYRGEAYVAEGTGTATIVSWTPNAMTVTVHGARPGEHLVLNQNWDPGWAADGRAAESWRDAVSVVLGAGEQTVEFRYRPRSLWIAMTPALLAISLLIALRNRSARWTERGQPPYRPGPLPAE
jgi:hypothetical protein